MAEDSVIGSVLIYIY